MNVLPTYMYIAYAHRVQKAVSNPPGLEVWVLLTTTWVLRTGPLQEQQVPLAVESFLQPPPLFLR